MYHPGNTAIVAAGAASANIALPVDAAGNQYQAVMLTATQPAWVAFCTSGSDAVVAATAPAILVNGFGIPLVLAVPGAGAGTPIRTNAGFLAAIEGSATAGTVCITGLY
jgi:hypothetical protein